LVDLPLFPFVFPLIVNYRDEFIGEQQPTSSVLYNGEAKGQRTGGRRSDGTGNDGAGHGTCFIGETKIFNGRK
jgi:hypothetical protein